MSETTVRVVVRVDPTRCRGHGMCALMFPDALELDRWGYGRPLDAELVGKRRVAQARRAARACPNDAITVSVERTAAVR
jgi:ferredoxin